MSKNIALHIYIIGLCYIILSGVSCWLTVEMRATYNVIIYSIIILSFFRVKNKIKNSTGYVNLLIVVLCLSSYFTTNQINIILVNVLLFLSISTLFFIDTITQKYIMKRINTVYTILVLLSLIFYLFIYAGFPIPSLGYQVFNQYTFINHIFCLDSFNYPGKFVGFSLEPGYFSLLNVSFLMLNRFDLRKPCVYVYLLAVLLSYSLGGYVLAIIGWLIYSYFNTSTNKKKIKFMLIFFISISLIYEIASEWNKGHNMINEKILDRLEYDKEKGIVGNNRDNVMAEAMFTAFFATDKIWFGIGSEGYLDKFSSIEGFDACSYKVFVVRYGLVYTIIFILAFTLYCIRRSPKNISLPVLAIYWLDFIQHGLPFASLFVPLLLFIETNKTCSIRLKSNKTQKFFNL